MEHASLLFYLVKPQSGGVLGCDLRHCTSEPFDFWRCVEACRAYGAYSQYLWVVTLLSQCRCSARWSRSRRLITLAAWSNVLRSAAWEKAKMASVFHGNCDAFRKMFGRPIDMSKNIDIDGGTKTCERFELSKCWRADRDFLLLKDVLV